MRRAAALLLALTLAACDNGDSRICGALAVKMDNIDLPANDPQNVTACVDRWAARLSKAPDDATTVAEAAIGACQDAISRHEAAIAKDADRPPDYPAARAYWKRIATFRAVQWRAGKCPIERAK
ncbi:hypothetical protein [Sphingomonas sp.]|jgi:hypothetical protein|uniref:hypothetical protein n=1 Tax=Sphingomonas sp. TaxID=28214 RepID=UPI002E102BBA|nr:hypothetical protein [Sphingomonas sp.]